MAYGAAGVLWALNQAGAAVPDDHVEWLVRALGPARGMGPGFYDGLSGIAFALDALGRRREATRLMELLVSRRYDPGDPSLLSGLAGIGLNFLHFADLTESPKYLEAATTVADQTLAALAGAGCASATPASCSAGQGWRCS